MALLIATVKIRGTKPLLFNRFTPESIPTTKIEKSGVPGNNPEEWRGTFSITSEQALYVDPSYIFSCIVNAARYTKRGRASIQPAVAATLQVIEDRILLNRTLPALDKLTQNPADDVYVDVRSVKMPSTRARNVRYRLATRPDWTSSFNICWENTLVDRKLMEAILIDAGQLEGLGDGRRIGFGRFVVESFVIQEEDRTHA